MSKKLTPWFPSGSVPARRGVYEVKVQTIVTSHGVEYVRADLAAKEAAASVTNSTQS